MRKLWIGLFAVVVIVLAGAAGSARAVGRMPVGFFDDPSFRWSTQMPKNLASAQAANGNIIHVLVNWSSVAPTKPANPLNANDPAYHLSDIDSLVKLAPKYGFQILMTIAQTPKWANGGQTPNYPPTNLNTLTQFCQMLATRYNGSNQGRGVVTRFSVWNEPNLAALPGAAVRRHEDRQPGDLREAVHGRPTRGSRPVTHRARRRRRDLEPRSQRADPPASDSVAPATFAHLVSEAEPEAALRRLGDASVPELYALGPAQRVAYPNVGFSTMSRFGADLQKWFHRSVPIWVTEYGELTAPAGRARSGQLRRSRRPTRKAALKLAQANPYVADVRLVHLPRQRDAAADVVQRPADVERYEEAVVQRVQDHGEGHARPVSGRRAGKKFSVKVPVPILAYYNAQAPRSESPTRCSIGKTLYAIGQPLEEDGQGRDDHDQGQLRPAKGKTYTMNVVASDRGGRFETTNVLLSPS